MHSNVTAMSWRKFLLVPTLVRSAHHAAKGVQAWDGYWGAIRRTGPSGDVLWDSASDEELAFCLDRARRHMDGRLPLIDVGCGNGRYSRAFLEVFPRVVGVDVSRAAIEIAERECVGTRGVTFQLADATAADFSAVVAAICPANVFVRGVLHVLTHRERIDFASNIQRILAGRGSLFLFETAFEGDPLAYIEFLGGAPGAIPRQLLHCIASGIPKPRCFGRKEFARYFPREQWETVADGEADVHAVGMRDDHVVERIPGFFAVVKPRSS